MVIILKNNCDKMQLDRLTSWLGEMHVTPQYTHGVGQTIMGLVGDTSKIDIDMLLRTRHCRGRPSAIAESVQKRQTANSIPKIPSSRSITALRSAAATSWSWPALARSNRRNSSARLPKPSKRAGATVLRGGAFKPRTSPYAFQGMREDGLKLLIQAKKKIGIPVVTEIMDYDIAVIRGRGHHPGRRTQHAELRAVKAPRQDQQADSVKTRSFEHLGRAAHER